jgi:CxxC motif-containing protein
VVNPVRIITSTIKIKSEVLKRLSVKTSKPIPKNKIFDIMKEINKIEVKAPIEIKDIIIKNVLELGVDIIATRSVKI